MDGPSTSRALVGARIAAVVLAVTALTGCGGAGDDARSTSRSTTSSAAAPGTAASYVGLSKRAAIAKADEADRPWRIGREDDEHFALTQDFVEDRVTFEIDDGEVTHATLG